MRTPPRRFGVEPLEGRTLLSVSLVKDMNTSPAVHATGEVAALGGAAYFADFDAASGVELWKSDGTDAGTVPVKGFRIGPDLAYAYSLTAFNGLLYFMANDGTSSAYRLWRSDGTAAGTVPVTAPLAPGAFGPFHLTAADGALYFAYGLPNGTELWKSDTGGVSTRRRRGVVIPRRRRRRGRRISGRARRGDPCRSPRPGRH